MPTTLEEPKSNGKAVSPQTELTGPQVVSGAVTQPELPSALKANYRKYREIRKEPTVALARALSVAPAIASSWSVVGEDDAREEWVEFVTKCFLPFHDHVVETAMYYANVDFGWQGYEKVFIQRDDGWTYLHKLKPLIQDITDILIDVKTGAFVGFKQRDSQGRDVILPLDKCLLISFRVEGTDWYGMPLLENIRVTYDQSVVSGNVAADYDAKIAGSKPHVAYPPGSSIVSGVNTPNSTIAENLLKALIKPNQGISTPKLGAANFKDNFTKEMADLLNWDITLLSDENPKQGNFVTRSEYLDKKMVRGLLTPERSILEGLYGTKADAGEHADIALTQREIEHDYITRMVNWHCVDQLLVANFGEDARSKVRLEAAPLSDTQKRFLRMVYQAALGGPVGADLSIAVDWEAVQQQIGVPIRVDADLDLEKPEPPKPFGGKDDEGMEDEDREKAEDVLDEDDDAEFSLADDSDGVWRTINGARVFIKGGAIEKGPKDLVGKKPSEVSKGEVSSGSSSGKSSELTSTEKEWAAAGRKWEDSISTQEKSSVGEYVENGYRNMIRVQQGFTADGNNDAERKERTEIFKKHVERFSSALDRAPKFQGELFRGDNMRVENTELQVLQTQGSEFTTDRFLSFTTSKSTAMKFVDDRAPTSKRQKLFISVKSRSGRDIRQFNYDEKEIVYPAGSRFRVAKVLKRADIRLVTLEEL